MNSQRLPWDLSTASAPSAVPVQEEMLGENLKTTNVLSMSSILQPDHRE